jgi:vacuolar-type H+-ATPase subunit H
VTPDGPTRRRQIEDTTAARLAEIVAAAEQAAKGVIDEAEAEARERLADATEEANRIVAERLDRLAGLTEELDLQAEALKSGAEALRAAVAEARAELGGVESFGGSGTLRDSGPARAVDPEPERGRTAYPEPERGRADDPPPARTAEPGPDRRRAADPDSEPERGLADESASEPAPERGERRRDPDLDPRRPAGPSLTIVGAAEREPAMPRREPTPRDDLAGRDPVPGSNGASERFAAPSPDPDFEAASNGTPAGARLLATQMAVSGSSREEIEQRLRSGFAISDTTAILDAILGPEH